MAAGTTLSRKLLLVLTVLIMLAGVTAGLATVVLSKEDRIIRGIQIRGVELGNATKGEGLEKANFLKESIESDTVTMVYDDHIWEFQARDLGLDVKAEEIVAKAMLYGRQGNLVEQFKERRQISREGLELPLYFSIDKNKLNRQLKEITKEFAIPPQDASFRVNPDDTIEIIPGKEGLEADLDQAYERFYKIIADELESALEVHFVNVEPNQKEEDIRTMKIKGLLSSFSTTFSVEKANRSFNIVIATKPFDNLLVKPGEIVSFNKIVGPRSSQNGYKVAPVIIKGKLVDGLGGGVCQVSTTLFNAALLADLEIVKRINHTLPVSYVPIGRDAAVVYDSVDFQIKNNTGGFLLIKSFVMGGTVVFKLFGDIDHKKDILLTSETTEVIPSTKVEYENDPEYPKGKTWIKSQPTPGYKAKAYRIVRENGKIIRKELIASSHYKAQPKIIAVGTNPNVKLPSKPVTKPPVPDVTPPSIPGTVPGSVY